MSVNHDKPRARLISFRRVNKGSLRGFCNVELPSGLIVKEVSAHVSHGKQWALMPSKPMIDRDGNTLRGFDNKVRYSRVNEWGTRELQQEFSRRVVELVRAQYPGLFDQ